MYYNLRAHLHHFLTILFLSNSILILSQEVFTINGYITSDGDGEKLIGANIIDLKSGNGTVSNQFGFYSISLPADSVVLQVSYIGYQTGIYSMDLTQDTDLDIALTSTINLQVVEVNSKRVERIEENVQMSKIDVPIQQIKDIPPLLGEVDVIKAMQLLPGVQSGGEGQTGMYVRGGSPDQNLILLDGVPVYSISHVAGLFSIFNADAIKNVSLLKGGFPARYGGRLSSVLEISMKDGNNQEFHGEGSIGLITSKLTLEGPINKGKTSFLVSGRRTYLDLIARPIARRAAATDDIDIRPKLHFYDFNAKVNHTFNDRHRVYLSLYNGEDILFSRVKEGSSKYGGGVDWGNWISAARWNHKITPKMFSNTTLIFSDYQFDAKVEIEEEHLDETSTFKTKYLSGIQDVGIKWDLDWIPNPQHYFRFGIGATRHRYDPGAITVKVAEDDVDLDTLIGNTTVQSSEWYAFGEDEFNLGKLKLNLGLHVSAFNAKNKFYSSLQPRINARFLMTDGWSLKGSFNTMAQYINLLATEALTLPTDLWVPSTQRIKPQRAWQVALGGAKSLENYEFSIETYYKKMSDVVSLKPGASFLFGLDKNWEEKITQGSGETYGAEFFVQKKTGKTTGWIGYTLAWNNRTFEDINDGKVFPFKYDRRHDISVVVNHQFNDRVSLSGTWIYGTGNAVTLPIENYSIAERSPYGGGYSYRVNQLGEKNSNRMSDYHRLDLGLSFSKQKKRHIRTWSFGAYNTYWHKNPYFVYAGQRSRWDPENLTIITRPVLKEVSILPFMVPYFSYGFKF